MSSLTQAQGAAIRHHRKSKDLSQAELARKVGITQASISNYEMGKRDLPLYAAMKIADALDIGLNTIAFAPTVKEE